MKDNDFSKAWYEFKRSIDNVMDETKKLTTEHIKKLEKINE